MILEINLLPNSPQKTQASSLKQIHRMPIVWILGGLLVSYVILLLGINQVNSYRLSKFNAKLTQLQPQRDQVDRLKAQVNQLRAEQSAFQGLGDSTTYLSQRLLAFAKAAPQTVWYSELILDSKEGMVVRGYAIAQNGAEMSQVGRLTQALSKSDGFVEDFGSVRIDSIKRVSDQNVEMVEFVLISVKDNEKK